MAADVRGDAALRGGDAGSALLAQHVRERIASNNGQVARLGAEGVAPPAARERHVGDTPAALRRRPSGMAPLRRPHSARAGVAPEAPRCRSQSVPVCGP